MADMYSKCYHINVTNGWDAQPVLLCQPYKAAAGHSQYYDIIITNGWDAQPVLPCGYYMNTQSSNSWDT